VPPFWRPFFAPFTPRSGIEYARDPRLKKMHDTTTVLAHAGWQNNSMKHIGHAVTTLALLATVATAHAASKIEAVDLGHIIGSEEACGLTFDQAAVSRLVEQNVDPDDADWLSMFDTAVEVETKVNLPHMTRSQLTAHCAQVRQFAKHFGLIK
jgi:hypothetical protein